MDLFDAPKVDSHCHILDPARFPYAPGVLYRPGGQEIAPLVQYEQVMAAYGIRHALFVGPNSGYNLDNRCLLDALAQGGGRHRGIAVVRHDITREELLQLRAAGVVGVAFNATVNGTAFYADAAPLLDQLAGLDMMLSMQAEHEQWLEIEPLLMDSAVRVMIDHCGRPRAGAGLEQPGFQAVLRLARRGGVAVKLSGFQKFSQRPPPNDDALPFVRALIDTYGLAHCLWATDWPFLRAPQRLDVGPLVRRVSQWLPDAADRHRLWWETPRHWLGF
jgi:predicted TIM-barrel fold metal-dependent hydrolase